MSDYVSDCCHAPMYKNKFYSSKKKKWLEEFWVCEYCDNPCTPIPKEEKDEGIE